MHYLGVPTTRSLSLMLSGDQVLRDVLYNGNPAYEKGAIVGRVAPSFIRFGSFEMLTARNELKNLKQFSWSTISNITFLKLPASQKEQYLAFFKKVADSTREISLVAGCTEGGMAEMNTWTICRFMELRSIMIHMAG